MIGKQIRLTRIAENGKFLFIPMDHGITVGPLPGIQDLEQTISEVAQGGATATILHKGPLMHLSSVPMIPIIMHVSASTNLGVPNRKVIIGTPEEALRLGADGFSIHVNIGAETEPEMLEDAGLLSETCASIGLPLLAMIYPRGPKIKNPYDPELVAHAARIGYELGADIVKTVYTGDPDSFKTVVQGCKVPVIIAGGPQVANLQDLFQMVADAVSAGGKGVAFGRNVFQANTPKQMVSAIHHLLFQEKTPNELAEEFK